MEISTHFHSQAKIICVVIPVLKQWQNDWRKVMITLPETKGREVVKFIQSCVVHGEGDYYGSPFLLDDWQKKIIFELYELKEDGERKYREALIGLPKGNGKSALVAAVGLYELIGSKVVSPLVACAASSTEQAALVFNTMRTMCDESPILSKLTETFENQIQVIGQSGRAYRVAAKAGTADGGRNSCFIADEIHEWNTPNLERVHYVLSNNTAKRQDGLVLSITTAGYDKETLAGELYNRGKRKETGEVEDDEFYFKWLEAEETDDVNDPEVWKRVNPAIQNDWWPLSNLERRFKSLPLNEFKRYHLNTWTKTKMDSWLPVGTWSECASDEKLKFDAQLPMYVGVDLALKHDSVGIVHVQNQKREDDEDDLFFVDAKIWFPDDQIVDYAEVENYIIELNRLYNVVECAYDPAFFERSAQELVDQNVNMVSFPQTHSRMVPACGNAYEILIAKKIRHQNYATFTDQVLSAAQKQTDNGWRLSKGRSKRKIDSCIAMVMALDRATAPLGQMDPAVKVIEW